MSATPKLRGFTLIELLVVIAIIAILAAMGDGGLNRRQYSALSKDSIGEDADTPNKCA